MLGDLRQIRLIPAPWGLRVWQRNQIYKKVIIALTRHGDSWAGGGNYISRMEVFLEEVTFKLGFEG